MVSLSEAEYMYRRDRLVAERNLLCKSSLIKKMEKKRARGREIPNRRWGREILIEEQVLKEEERRKNRIMARKKINREKKKDW